MEAVRTKERPRDRGAAWWAGSLTSVSSPLESHLCLVAVGQETMAGHSQAKTYISEANPAIRNPLILPQLDPPMINNAPSERDPLIPSTQPPSHKKSWLGHASPSLLVPFVLSAAIAASLVSPCVIASSLIYA